MLFGLLVIALSVCPGWKSFSLHNLRRCGRILDIDYSRTRGLVVTERLGERQRRLD